jgi:hypothetical protein
MGRLSVAHCCEEGRSFVKLPPDTPAAEASFTDPLAGQLELPAQPGRHLGGFASRTGSVTAGTSVRTGIGWTSARKMRASTIRLTG